MESAAHIHLKSDTAEIRFEWLGFDGDDCFNDFHIIVTEGGHARRFDFGPCVVSGLRKLAGFFNEATQATVGGGFRHPDIRHYDVYRSADGYRLVVRFEGSRLHEELHIQRPALHVDDEFLKAYDS